MIYAHNLLSASRIVATPLCAALVMGGSEWAAAAFVVAALTAFTDLIDGPIARRCGRATYFGAMLDMTSDKVFLCSMLIVLAVVGQAPVWAAVIITARELMVLWLRVIASEHQRPLPIVLCGRLKTFMLFLLVPLALAGAPWEAVWVLAGIASLSAAASLVEYLVKMRAELMADFFLESVKPNEA